MTQEEHSAPDSDQHQHHQQVEGVNNSNDSVCGDQQFGDELNKNSKNNQSGSNNNNNSAQVVVNGDSTTSNNKESDQGAIESEFADGGSPESDKLSTRTVVQIGQSDSNNQIGTDRPEDTDGNSSTNRANEIETVVADVNAEVNNLNLSNIEQEDDKMTVITHPNSGENIREIIGTKIIGNSEKNPNNVVVDSGKLNENDDVVKRNLENSMNKSENQRSENAVGETKNESKDDDPIVRLNKLRASISSALSEVKGVLKQYSTEQSFDEDNESANTAKSAEGTDDGVVRFRFVRKIRRRSQIPDLEEEKPEKIEEKTESVKASEDQAVQKPEPTAEAKLTEVPVEAAAPKPKKKVLKKQSSIDKDKTKAKKEGSLSPKNGSPKSVKKVKKPVESTKDIESKDTSKATKKVAPVEQKTEVPKITETTPARSTPVYVPKAEKSDSNVEAKEAITAPSIVVTENAEIATKANEGAPQKQEIKQTENVAVVASNSKNQANPTAISQTPSTSKVKPAAVPPASSTSAVKAAPTSVAKPTAATPSTSSVTPAKSKIPQAVAKPTPTAKTVTVPSADRRASIALVEPSKMPKDTTTLNLNLKEQRRPSDSGTIIKQPVESKPVTPAVPTIEKSGVEPAEKTDTKINDVNSTIEKNPGTQNVENSQPESGQSNDLKETKPAEKEANSEKEKPTEENKGKLPAEPSNNSASPLAPSTTESITAVAKLPELALVPVPTKAVQVYVEPEVPEPFHVPKDDVAKKIEANKKEGIASAAEQPKEDEKKPDEEGAAAAVPTGAKKKKTKRRVIIRRVKRKLSKEDIFHPVVEEAPVTEVSQKDIVEEPEEKVEEEPKEKKSCLKRREFEEGEAVLYAERYKKTQVRWKKAVVVERISSTSYKLEYDGEVKPAYISYIKRYHDKKVNFGGKEYLEIDYEQIEEEEEAHRNWSIWSHV